MLVQTHMIEHDQWMITPSDQDYLEPDDRWCRVCARPDREHLSWMLRKAEEHGRREWADGLLLRDVLNWFDLDESSDYADEILSAYEAGYSSGVVAEVERAATYLVGEGGEDA